MALLRRGRKPKVVEAEDVLDEETGTVSSVETVEKLSQRTETQETAEENESGEKAARMVVRARVKKPPMSRAPVPKGVVPKPAHNETPSLFNTQVNGSAETNSLPPLSLPKNLPSMPDIYGRPEPRLDQDNGKPRLTINELIRLNMMDLRELAACYNISHDDMVALKKQEIIFSIMKAHTERGGIIYAYGSLEILPDSYGFLRSPQNSYLPGPDDIYISPSQIRLFALKTGDTVYGQIRSPKEGERFFAMLRVETVNYDDPTVAQNRIPFDNLTPLYPHQKLDLETSTEGVSERITCSAPSGKASAP